MNNDVTAYINQQETWKKLILAALRQAIHEADPGIEEAIKWGTPAFLHGGIVAWMFCATEWVHFSFPQGALLDASHGRWDEGPDTASQAKRTIKFRESEEVPVKLIEKLTKEAVANNLAGRKIDFHTTKPGSKRFDLPREYKTVLGEAGLLDAYQERPYYQQKGWVEWIEQAKRPETRQKRILKMQQELQDGTYMPPAGSAA